MIDDFGRALIETGHELTIDGELVQVLAGPVETVPGEFDRQLISTWKIFHLAGALEKKVPGQLVEIDGERWEVIDHRAAGVSVCLSLMRSAG